MSSCQKTWRITTSSWTENWLTCRGNDFIHNRLRDLWVYLLKPVVEPGIGVIVSGQEFDFDGNAHGPDVSFVALEKVPLLNRKLRVQRFVPDLAVEIVSENDTFKNLLKKATRYHACGTKEVWIFEQDLRKAFVLSKHRSVLLGEDDLFESELIPGFSIRLGELFERAGQWL